LFEFIDFFFFNIFIDSFQLSAVDSVGIQIQVDALAGELGFDAAYLFTSVSSVAQFNASLSITLAIAADNSTPTSPPQISVAAIQFKIAHLTFHNTSSIIWQVIFDFSDEIARLVSGAVDSAVPATLATDLAAFFVTNPPVVTLGNLSFAAGLSLPPVFSSANGVVLFLSGSAIMDPATNATCVLPAAANPIVIDTAPMRPVQVYVDQSFADCVLASQFGSTLINDTIAQLLANVQLTHKLSLSLATADAPLLNFSSAGLALEFDLLADIERVDAYSRHATNGASVGIALSFNVSARASVALGVDAASQNLTANGTVTRADVHVGIAPGFQFSPDFPAQFREQINSTDFARLDGMLATMVNGSVLPQVNAQLGKSVVTPAHLPVRGINPLVEWRNSLVVVGFDVPPLPMNVTARSSACAALADSQSHRRAQTTCQYPRP
jgi:hypothetical protein